MRSCSVHPFAKAELVFTADMIIAFRSASRDDWFFFDLLL